MHRHPEAAFVSRGRHEAVTRERRVELLRRLVEQHRAAREHRGTVREVVGGDALDARHGRLAGGPEERVVRSVGDQEDDPHRVEVERGPHRFAEGRHDLADVERGAEELRDPREHLRAPSSSSLAVEAGDHVDEGADEAPERAHVLDVGLVERADLPARRTHVTDDPRARGERRHDRRPQAVEGVAVGSEARVGGHVGDRDDPAVEHGAEQRVGRRKARHAPGIGRVVVGRRGHARSTMLREHRERAPVVGEAGDAKAVVRNELVQRGGEIVEKRARLELAFDGSPDRREAHQEIRVRQRLRRRHAARVHASDPPRSVAHNVVPSPRRVRHA